MSCADGTGFQVLLEVIADGPVWPTAEDLRPDRLQRGRPIVVVVQRRPSRLVIFLFFVYLIVAPFLMWVLS